MVHISRPCVHVSRERKGRGLLVTFWRWYVCFLEECQKQMKAIMCCRFPLSQCSGLVLGWRRRVFFSWRRRQKHKTKVQRKAKPAPYLSTHRVIKVTGNIVYVSGRVTLTLSSRFESFYSSTVTCVRLSTCRSRRRIKTQGWNRPPEWEFSTRCLADRSLSCWFFLKKRGKKKSILKD